MNNSRGSKIACAIILICAATAISAPAQTFTNLVDFDIANGQDPLNSPLVIAPNGNLYGTTLTGGAIGVGTVFEITPAGVLTTVYSFCSEPNCTDGYLPWGGLAVGPDGNLYGTTNGAGVNGQGTVFKYVPGETLTTIYNFCSLANCADGGNPQAELALGANGNLYGTTSSGGAHSAGTVFEISIVGKLTPLYSFCAQTNCADGSGVLGPLTLAANGFYGVTSGGGAGWGTVFFITKKGALTTLHNFAFTDGANPWGGLLKATDGNLYGTTSGGGRAANGTVFRMSTAGKLATIYNFCPKAYCLDGIAPLGTLIQGSNGDLYGTTEAGGTFYVGTIFEITTKGALTTLHNFAGTDGSYPYAGLVEDSSNGTFYGTTTSGGDLSCMINGGGCGTVFSLIP